jgi:RNA recognition motif-containing protein
VGYSPSRIYHSAASGRQLFVGRIPFRMHWQDLKDLFKEAGEVVRAEVAFDETGKSKGFGQVIMASKNDAENAIRLLNGREVEGRAIEVREDKFAHESAFSVFVGNVRIHELTCIAVLLCEMARFERRF